MKTTTTSMLAAARSTVLPRISKHRGTATVWPLLLLAGALTSTAPAASQASDKTLAATSSRDLNPFLVAPYPASPFLTPDDVTLGRTYPDQPPTVVRRDMLTGTTMLSTAVGRLSLSKYQNLVTVNYIRPFDFVPIAARPLGESGGPIFLPFHVDRIQPGTTLPALSTDSAVSDRYTFGAPALRNTLDGSIYESVAISIERNGAPFTTLQFGYRMGLVAAQTAANVPAADREHYELVSLPAPQVEGLVTEHIFRPLATGTVPRLHLFYAASDAERAILDESTDWMRSGYEFKSGGYVPVCRFFYKPPNGGPSTHVYTAKADECEALKSTAGFNFEGTPFRASLPRPPAAGQSATDPALCPESTKPIWRAFNRPVDASVAPNHRYVTSVNVILLGTPPSWANEGIAFCVPQ